MCSAPSRSIISVPEATTLPRVPRPMRRSNSVMSCGGNPAGNVGNGRSSTTPIISQCPVTESLPADTSAIRPCAPRGGPGGEPASGARRSRPSDRSVGSFSGTCRAMLPRVLLPSSPYAAASGSAPIPTLSRTIRMTRVNTPVERGGPPEAASCSWVLRGEVVGDGALRGNGGDRVLEHQVIGSIDLHDHGEAIEVLDARVELTAVDQMNVDRQSLAAREVEKYVLDVRLRGRCTGFGCDLGHLVEPFYEALPLTWSPRAPNSPSTRMRVSRCSPGPSNQTRLGSLRN